MTSLPPDRSDRLARATLSAIVLLAAVGYALTAPRWILGGDNGEFATMYATGGIAHPPGYPAMVIWLRLFQWLPVSTPAHGAALANVVLGAIAVWTVQRACLAWGASIGSTAFVSAIFAFSPLAWKLGCHAEVFAMNAALAGAILALSAPGGNASDPGAAPRPALSGTRLVVALGVLAGTGISNNQSIILLAPIGLLAAVRAVRQSPRPLHTAAAGVLALLGTICAFYSYVYWLARTHDPLTTPMWIEAPNLAGVWFHFRRGAYGSFREWDTAKSATGGGSHVGANLAMFARAFVRHTLGMPIVVLLAWAVSARRRTGEPAGEARHPRRASFAALAAAMLLAGPGLVGPFTFPLEGAGPQVAERFYLLPEIILTVMGAVALDVLTPWLWRRPILAPALALQAAIAATILTLPEVLEHNRPTVELYVKNTLKTAPEGAVIVGSGDHRWGAFMYARYALGLRPDVAYVEPGLIKQAWYRALSARRIGVSFDTPDHKPIGPKTTRARLLASGRPVFYTDWPEPQVADTKHYTVGTLMRALPDGEAPPSAEELLALNLETYAQYELEPSPPSDPTSWAYDLQADYARAWGELGGRFAEEGDVGRQQACYARAVELAPWVVKVTAR